METINHEYYVSLEVAKLLKEAGFDWETRATYRYDNAIGKVYILTHYVTSENWNGVKEDNIDYVSAPTLEVAQRWLRDAKNIDIDIRAHVYMLHVKVYVPYISTYRPYVVTESDKYFGITEEEAKKNNWFEQTQFALTYDNDSYPEHKYFYSYEEAQEAGIKKALEMILEKGK